MMPEEIQKLCDALQMSADDMMAVRVLSALDLLLAHAGITEEQVQLAMKSRLETEIKNSAHELLTLIENP